MKKIITEEFYETIKERRIAEAIEDFLNDNLHMARTNAIAMIALNLDENYREYSKLLLTEMTNEIHFGIVRLGAKSAWALAIALAENLKPEDYAELQKQFAKWDDEEKELLLDWIKDFPEQISILTTGKLE